MRTMILGMLLTLTTGGITMTTSGQSGEGWAVYKVEEVDHERRQQKRSYLEFFRAEDLSTGLYVLPVGATDKQSPHGEDEIYYVLSGQAQIRIAEAEQPVANGSVVYVKAGVPHHFFQIEEELKVLVVFAPAFGTAKEE